MTTATVSKWGASQGIRLPKAFCEQLGIKPGSQVNIALVDNSIIIERPEADYTIQARMKAWDGTRLATSEFDWGAPVGKEIW